MVRSKRIPTHADPLNVHSTGLAPSHFQHPAGPELRFVARPLAAMMWIVGGMALFALYLRISFIGSVTSDAANNALQAWDMLHGHLLLHGWIIGDATYYTFDLPVLAVSEIFFGLCDLSSHVASALMYLIVTVSAVAVAVTDSRGYARVARCGVVVAVLTAMFHVGSNAPYLLGAPDHTGTSAFLLLSFLLIDRVPARWYTSSLLLAILCAGQIGDATVRYVAVPAVVVVCGYRAVAARTNRTGDATNALAAAASVPLASAVRAVMLHFGAYQMIAPKTAISSPRQWPQNAALAWHALRVLFGAEASSPSLARDAGYILGLACLLAAAAGFARVAGYWDSSVTTLQSGNQVQIRAVAMYGRQVFRYDWETNTLWFDTSRHNATFVITDLAGSDLSPSVVEPYFGKPAKIEHVAQWTILIYQKNLLEQVAIAGTGPRWLAPGLRAFDSRSGSSCVLFGDAANLR